MKHIKVNKEVIISNRYAFGLGFNLNIYAVDDSQNGFVQFVMSMDSEQQCCEEADMEISHDAISGQEVFVKDIEIYGNDEEKKVLIKCEDDVHLVTFYNIHNGYYAHSIFSFVSSDGEKEYLYNDECL